ncbi:unnamed protein product [Ilex paraguariensis]|uniref:Uncharacterized protein n=1 Tax=Ilex paraguariensis TaxID=185542 RepID=A0ABC8TSN5_9AQUA
MVATVIAGKRQRRKRADSIAHTFANVIYLERVTPRGQTIIPMVFREVSQIVDWADSDVSKRTNDILKLGGFNLEELDVFVAEELIDGTLGTASQQAVSDICKYTMDLGVRIGRLEVVAERMEKKFDTFASHCTKSLFVLEKRLGEIGQIVSQFVDTSAPGKDVPHDMGGNKEEAEIDLTHVCTLPIVLGQP